jgi:hypothetical protein
MENMRLGERRYCGRVRATVSGEVRTRSLLCFLVSSSGLWGFGGFGLYWRLTFSRSSLFLGLGGWLVAGSCSGSGSGFWLWSLLLVREGRWDCISLARSLWCYCPCSSGRRCLAPRRSESGRPGRHSVDAQLVPFRCAAGPRSVLDIL